MIRRGEEWGTVPSEPPDLHVAGGDAALARALMEAGPGPLVRFEPRTGSGLARAVGLTPGRSPHRAVSLDVLRVTGGRLAVNGVVAGAAPDRLRPWHRTRPVEVVVDGQRTRVRATSVAVMNGQYWRDANLSPRGHPGDGTAEVQVYVLGPGDRRAMRSRLPRGAHLPHPGITVRRARRVELHFARAVPVELDGEPAGRAATLVVEVVPAAYRLLV